MKTWKAVLFVLLIGIFIIQPVVEWSVYGPIISHDKELERLIRQDKVTLNLYDDDRNMLSVNNHEVESSIRFVSKHNYRIVSRIPFMTEYYMAFYTKRIGYGNVRIEDGTELHRIIRQKHKELKEKTKENEPTERNLYSRLR